MFVVFIVLSSFFGFLQRHDLCSKSRAKYLKMFVDFSFYFLSLDCVFDVYLQANNVPSAQYEVVLEIMS